MDSRKDLQSNNFDTNVVLQQYHTRYANSPKSQSERIQNRVSAVINGTVNRVRNKRALLTIFKCQSGPGIRLFVAYFKKLQHHKVTRGNNIYLLPPKDRTDAGRKSFLFQWSTIINKPPNALKDEQTRYR